MNIRGSKKRYPYANYICSNCGVNIYCRENVHINHFCSRECQIEYLKNHGNWNTGLTKDTDKRIADRTKTWLANHAMGLHKNFGWMRGLTKENDSRIAKMAIKRKGKGCHKQIDCQPDVQLICQNCSKDFTVKYKERNHKFCSKSCKISYGNTKRWQNTYYREKTIKRLMSTLKPNKLEIQFGNWLEGKYPGNWKYVGNGQLIIGGKNPDYANTNGKKALIEIYGDYWHANPLEYSDCDSLSKNGVVYLVKDIWNADNERIKIFESMGYKTLILWEHELNNMPEVESKVSNWLGAL